ncbi:hypothetical protein M2271_000818 [Streptomyces sp. LBL]|uniref:hypothetical protein n=1 Tax=Streptomyces sp. LBL TaxID=2940562 RepID=UPI002474F3A7|nr:hypothetical protein [Streptomyces sp. LBL]MDH6623031.1 hypothetical protein [Streptomyces sp. LBL]
MSTDGSSPAAALGAAAKSGAVPSPELSGPAPQTRTGGRNRTARKGDKLHELDGEGNSPVLTHTCAFDRSAWDGAPAPR